MFAVSGGSRAPRPFRLAAACLVALTVGLAPGGARAAELYVAPGGSDTGAGTMAAPFATLTKANSVAAAGDTIWVRGGTYYLTSQVVLSKSGTSDANRTKVFAYQGETPVFDVSRYVTSNSAVDVPVVLVTGSWMHLRGLEIANAKVGASGDHSYSLLRTKNASNNTFELLHLHHAFGPALFIDTGTGGNLILNCDAHDNYDKDGSQGDGQNGDGFGVHYQTTGPSTIIRGCRAWANSDDGYDFISQEVPITIEKSFAMQNGYGAEGNGNGFKIGSSKNGVRHIVQNNVAWKNKAAGFYANHSSGGNTWLNNTSYNNGTQYNMLASPPDDTSMTIVLSGSLAHKMRNNVGFPNKNVNMTGVDSASNSWDLGIAETAADFASTADAGCTGPREADGSLPSACTFLRLKAGSPLIDRGVNVGLPFVGAAPDLGAYELGAAATGGAGGGVGGTATGGQGVGGSGGRTAGTGGGRTGGSSGTGGSFTPTGGSDATPGTGGRGLGGAATGGASVGNTGGAGPASSGGAGATGLGPGPGMTGGNGGPDDANATTGCSCRSGSDQASDDAGVTMLAGGLLAAALVGSRRRRASRH